MDTIMKHDREINMRVLTRMRDDVLSGEEQIPKPPKC